MTTPKMTSTKTLTEITAALAVALSESSKAKACVAESNPLGNHTLEQVLNGAGIMKSADLIPQQSTAPMTRGEWLGSDESNRVVRDGLESRKNDRSAKRMAAARARAKRKQDFDEIANLEVTIVPERMTEAWMVVFPLVPIITRIANSKRQWAARFLGSLSDDLAQMALEKSALVLAKSDKNLALLRVAADELGAITAKSGQIPGHQVTDEERKERKQIALARKWLMGLVNNRVMGALVDAYTEVNNLRWENLDVIATVMASISGVGEDPLFKSSKANRAPAMLGTRYDRPGGISAEALATAISAAITERGLDRMVELLLDQDNVRTDGAFMWAENAEQAFLASPHSDGAWMWDVVCRSTEKHDRPRRARADAARVYVRSEFSWMPQFIVSVINAMDPQRVAHVDGHAIMASTLDGFRQVRVDTTTLAEERPGALRPMLTYATAMDAAHALVEHLSFLYTGEELVSSIVHA